jgi:AhpD family alkylhydroperoxidase
MEEHQHVFPLPSRELSQKRRELAPTVEQAFREFSHQVFTDDALDAKTKQLIAVAVAHVTQCPYCIRGHTKSAHREGASEKQIMEAIWVAAEMRAGAAYAHSVIALAAMESDDSR